MMFVTSCASTDAMLTVAMLTTGSFGNFTHRLSSPDTSALGVSVARPSSIATSDSSASALHSSWLTPTSAPSRPKPVNVIVLATPATRNAGSTDSTLFTMNGVAITAKPSSSRRRLSTTAGNL